MEFSLIGSNKNAPQNMQDITKTIKIENNFSIKEEPEDVHIKEEFLVYSELEKLEDVLVKQELSALYQELQKYINVGLSVPHEEFERFASNVYVEEELLMPYDDSSSEENTCNSENPNTKYLQNNHGVPQECYVKLAKLPPNFERYPLKELESLVPHTLNISDRNIKIHYTRSRKQPLQTGFDAHNIRIGQTAKRYERCYYPDKRYLTCNMCDYKTRYKYLLTRHAKIHKGGKPYACSMCDFRSAQKKDYVAHRTIHKGNKPFTCTLCDFRATRKSYVTKHKYAHFPEEDFFTCHTCRYKTPFKSNLQRHLLIHSVKKPFHCNVCGFKTVHKSVIKSHERIHSGEKPFACKSCTYTTCHYSSLRKHAYIHTGKKTFTCNICDHKTRFKEHLKRHLKTHSGEKPYACHICNFSTAHKESLKMHINIHNKKRFTCNICEFSSYHISSVQRHLRRMHNRKRMLLQKTEIS